MKWLREKKNFTLSALSYKILQLKKTEYYHIKTSNGTRTHTHPLPVRKNGVLGKERRAGEKRHAALPPAGGRSRAGGRGERSRKLGKRTESHQVLRATAEKSTGLQKT